MANLTKLRLNSNEYALGSTITKINVNGTIYGIGKDRNTVGVNGAIGINDSYPNVALNIGTTPQNTIAKDGNRYAAIQVPDGSYNGESYVGVKTADVGIYESDIRYGKSIFNVVGQFTGDANLPASSVVESYHGYAQGNHIYGSIPKRSEVGYNGVIGISDVFPFVGFIKNEENLQYVRTTSGEDSLALQVPQGYYNGQSYLGCNISRLTADGADTASAIWGSQALLMSYSLGINFDITDTNYLRFRQNYTHQRYFRLFAATSSETGIHVTKSYGSYKDFRTSNSGFLHPYLDTTWEDTVEPTNCYRVHMDGWPSVNGIMILFTWRKW